MPLSPGEKLGPYEILAPLGAGGMGEVYRAKDTRLNRPVAIKIAARDFGDRFEREARAIAALNHPSICTLYDIGPNYLVMELVEGETLAARLRKGRFSVEQTVQYGAQIAEALAEAHAHGITHRDLKPGNVMLTKSGVKVLDFGLAKSVQDETLTLANAVMGTPAYMAPEQMEGKSCDARTDIYALGLILVEMATGKRKSTDGLSGPFAHVMERCLEHDPARRWQAASDVKAELEWAGKATLESPPPRSPKIGTRTIIAGAAVVAVAVGALAIWAPWRTAPPARAVRFEIAVPRDAINPGVLALSPDGRYLAFSARGLTGAVRSLWVRAVGSSDARILSGSEGPGIPFWSPDSQFVATFTAAKLIKIDIGGGPPQTICDCTGTGGSWSKHGVIIYYDSAAHLMRVSASGGTPTMIAEGPASYPLFLPDGLHFLYRSGPGNSRVYVGALDGSIPARSREVAVTALAPAYAPPTGSGPSHLLFMRDGTLFAQPFDARKLETAGEPTPLVEHLQSFGNTGYFAASMNDVLVYRVKAAVQDTQLTWFDSQGKSLGTVGESGSHITLALSPDGNQAAFGRLESPTNPNTQVWLLDLVRGSATRFSSGEGSASRPVWSPDGRSIVFLRNREGLDMLYRKPVGGGDEDLLLTSRRGLPWSWSPDGRLVLYQTYAGSADLWTVPVEGERKPTPYVRSEFDELEGKFSPDGRWVAYVSNVSGRDEVYVREFSAPGSAAGSLVSNGGGNEPHWHSDGKQLLYRAGRNLVSVDITTAPSFQARSPAMLFQLPLGADDWDVTADGQRFLVAVPLVQNTPQPFTVVLNWQGMLKK
jgi:eukaryotic-like serine/threonine-protein kinase